MKIRFNGLDHIVKTMAENHERIESFAAYLDLERKELLSDRIRVIAEKIDTESDGHKVLKELRDMVKPEKLENEDNGEREGEKV